MIYCTFSRKKRVADAYVWLRIAKIKAPKGEM